jgi:hypothetical protein
MLISLESIFNRIQQYNFLLYRRDIIAHIKYCSNLQCASIIWRGMLSALIYLDSSLSFKRKRRSCVQARTSMYCNSSKYKRYSTITKRLCFFQFQLILIWSILMFLGSSYDTSLWRLPCYFTVTNSTGYKWNCDFYVQYSFLFLLQLRLVPEKCTLHLTVEWKYCSWHQIDFW